MRHALIAAGAVTWERQQPTVLFQSGQPIVLIELCLRSRERVWNTERPIAQALDRDSPTVAIQQLFFDIVEFRAGTVLIGQNRALSLSLDSDSTDSERTTDRCIEVFTILFPAQLAVKAVFAGTHRNAPGEFPLILR